jgi:hypothetical protein
MSNEKEKTHWMQSPNKNYLGHWDLPESGELNVTIESAQWEVVKDPVSGRSESKRVVRFTEPIKPLICNQTNANAIVRSSGIKFMEDSKGVSICLFIDTIDDRRTKEKVDCIRVKTVNPYTLEALIALRDEKFAIIPDNVLERLTAVIDNNEVSSYAKTINYLEALK